MAVDSLHDHSGPVLFRVLKLIVSQLELHKISQSWGKGKLWDSLLSGAREPRVLRDPSSLLLDKIVGGSWSNFEMSAFFFFFPFFSPFLPAGGICAHVVQAREQLWNCMQAGWVLRALGGHPGLDSLGYSRFGAPLMVLLFCFNY